MKSYARFISPEELERLDISLSGDWFIPSSVLAASRFYQLILESIQPEKRLQPDHQQHTVGQPVVCRQVTGYHTGNRSSVSIYPPPFSVNIIHIRSSLYLNYRFTFRHSQSFSVKIIHKNDYLKLCRSYKSGI